MWRPIARGWPGPRGLRPESRACERRLGLRDLCRHQATSAQALKTLLAPLSVHKRTLGEYENKEAAYGYGKCQQSKYLDSVTRCGKVLIDSGL